MVHITFSKGITFDQCSFRATGGYAWWAEQGAYDCQLTRSSLTDLGGGAVRIGRGHAVDATAKAECEGHLIENNIMKDGGHVCQEGCGVLAQNIGNSTITHNDLCVIGCCVMDWRTMIVLDVRTVCGNHTV